jgi:hypothetical protein
MAPDPRGYRASKRLWTAAEEARLRREYPDTPTQTLARAYLTKPGGAE